MHFNQNTVPFDFDGKRLLWLTYHEKGVRELNIFHFDDNRIEMVHRFNKNDGMISQVKFLKNHDRQNGKYIIYVKDTINIIKFNLVTKSAEILG